jgi:hypothetical protein
MGYPTISWIPRGASTTQSLSCSAIAHSFSLLEGGVSVDRAQAFTKGGKTTAVVHDAWHQYTVEMEGFGPEKSSNYASWFSWLTSWWSHASAGGTFSFALNSDKAAATTCTGSVAETATSLTAVSTSGFAANDWVFLESATDPTCNCRRRVTSISGGTVSFATTIGQPLPTGSVLRHSEYFPSVVCLDDDAPFKERRGGKGANLWDLKMKIRTVR